MILATLTPDSPEWHEARRTRVGGSDIGTVMGWSPWETRDDLLHRKAGLAEPRAMTRAMRQGHWLEPAVLAHVCDKHDVALDPEASAATYVHDDNPRHLYNPDAIATDGTLIEAKSTRERSEITGWGRGGTDLIPRHYMAQVQWGLHVTGLTRAVLGVISTKPERGGFDWATYRIRRNDDLIAWLIEEANRFLDDLDHLLAEKAAA